MVEDRSYRKFEIIRSARFESDAKLPGHWRFILLHPLSSQFLRFLCLRAASCGSLIHTISWSAWRSSAYPHPYIRIFRSPLLPISCFPAALYFLFAALPLCRTSPPLRTSSTLHKDQSIKNAILHEINPLDTFILVPHPTVPFYSRMSPTLGSWRFSSEQERSANYRRSDVILKLLFSPFAQEQNMSSALITLTITSDIRRRRGKSG